MNWTDETKREATVLAKVLVAMLLIYLILTI